MASTHPLEHRESKVEPVATGSGSTLVLNIFPATFSTDRLNVFVGPYRDDGHYAAVRAAENGWTAWRDRNDGSRIVVWRHDGNTEFVRPGFKPAVMTMDENVSLFCRVMLDGIDRHLRDRGFVRLRGRGTAYANWATGNVFDRVFGKALDNDPRIGIFPEIHVESFVTSGAERGRPFVGLIVDVDSTLRFDIPVDELVRSGFDVSGRYVKLRAIDGETLTGDEGSLIGRVRSIEAGTLILDDTRSRAYQEIESRRCTLDAYRGNQVDYLRQRLGTTFDRLSTVLDREHLKLIAPPQRLHFSREFVRQRLVTAANGPIALAPDLGVSFGSAVVPAPNAATFRIRELPAPVYSFDPESPKTHEKATDGLRIYGPYDRAKHQGQRPAILVLAPDTYKGQVQLFLSAFKNGVMGGRLYEGFAKKYRLGGVDFTEHYFPLTGTPKDAYYNATVAALELRKDYDAAFVVIREDYHELPPTDDPYCVSKVMLLSFGVPVQDLEIETLRKDERSLQFILQNVALATYAKTGATPFVLRARQLERHELVFGIGKSDERVPGARLSAVQQVIGFTAVFRSDGDYLLNSCTPYTDVTQYERHLEDLVARVVPEVGKNEGIAAGETLRLVFHVYKSTGRREVVALENAIAKLPAYAIEYALMHVNDTHHIRLYDTAGENSMPARRTLIELGPRERLVVLIGPKQYLGRGTPAQMRITLDKASTFKDLDYLTQQLYEFSAVSWRTFNLSTQPVTVNYSELMARLNSRLRTVVPWNQDLIRMQLKRKLWFL